MLKKVYKKFESILLTLFSLGSVELHSLHILLNFFERNKKNILNFQSEKERKLNAKSSKIWENL